MTWLAWLCHEAEVRVGAAGAQYKFIVDGDWKYAPDQPAMYDEDNNVNNVLEVQEYVPENLASLSSFDPPPSPPERSAPAMCWQMRVCKGRTSCTSSQTKVSCSLHSAACWRVGIYGFKSRRLISMQPVGEGSLCGDNGDMQSFRSDVCLF